VPEGSSPHRATLELLGAAPGRHPLDRTLPAAVAEWLDAPEVREGRVHVAPGFYVRLDEGDDPPVYHETEGLVAIEYSTFVFDLAAAQRLSGQHLTARGPVPDAAALTWLGEHLRPGPVTRTEALTIHRFFGPHEYATVRWAPGEDAEWRLEADSPDALDALRATVDRAAGVPPRGLMTRVARATRRRRRRGGAADA
jgi:hypothetical protein